MSRSWRVSIPAGWKADLLITGTADGYTRVWYPEGYCKMTLVYFPCGWLSPSLAEVLRIGKIPSEFEVTADPSYESALPVAYITQDPDERETTWIQVPRAWDQGDSSIIFVPVAWVTPINEGQLVKLLSFTPASGVQLISEERHRQLAVEDFPAEWDDKHHQSSELTDAAICYATVAADQVAIARAMTKMELHPTRVVKLQATAWSAEQFKSAEGDDLWRLGDWKPSDDPIRNLVKAGALIAAEIDRLQRLKSNTKPQHA